jgi:hypothetical protein
LGKRKNLARYVQLLEAGATPNLGRCFLPCIPAFNATLNPVIDGLGMKLKRWDSCRCRKAEKVSYIIVAPPEAI